MATIKERLATLEAESKHHTELGESIVDKLDVIHDKLDKRYAGKWVERFNLGMIGLILTAVGSSLVGLVVKATSLIHRG